MTVPAGCFMPRPNVDSAVIKLTRHAAPPVTVPDEKFMFDLIRAAFNQRRKTLVNALGNAAGLCLEKDSILCALEKMECAPTIRGGAHTRKICSAGTIALREPANPPPIMICSSQAS